MHHMKFAAFIEILRLLSGILSTDYSALIYAAVNSQVTL